MIELFGHEDASVLGVATMLDTEKIPYRRVPRLLRDGAPLVIAAGQLGDGEISALAGRRAVVLDGGPRFAARALGAAATPRRGACVMPISRPAWPAHTVELARAHGAATLRVALAPYSAAPEPRRGVRLATLVPGDDPQATPLPALIQLPGCVWSSIDLGAAFTHLLGEDAHGPAGGAAAPERRWRRRLAQAAYYVAPEALRRVLRAGIYARLRRRIEAAPVLHSTYPVDATGWLLLELLRALVLRIGGPVVGLERWPAPYAAAAVLTHDLEPRRYAYTAGVRRLLARSAAAPPPAFGLVVEASRRHLEPETWRRLRAHDVICHGRTHSGERRRGGPAIAGELRGARAALEALLGRRVHGYRSPRLDRSPDLVWALDHAGFDYDSSYPDIDRENPDHFGAGVRFNLPYRPLLDDGLGLRRSRCLELPLSAPDCIQPLFAGDSETALRAAVAAKAAFIRQTGGLYCALVHAGVFGDADAARRERHLEVVLAALRADDVWRPGIGALVDWWRRREAVEIALSDDVIAVINTGRAPIHGLRLRIESRRGRRTLLLPRLEPGARHLLRAEAVGAAERRVEVRA